MYQTIVVGAHKSQPARKAVDAALELGRVLDAHVHLVGAYPKDKGPIEGGDTAGRVDAQRSLDAIAPHGPSPRCTTHALPGDPARAILQVANEVGAQLIVVGNKRTQGTGRILGSVPNHVAHHAPCAVLIVKST